MNKLARRAPEERERAVRVVLEHQAEHCSQEAEIGAVAAIIGCQRETFGGAKAGQIMLVKGEESPED